jgi:hypothetical protein
MNKTRLALLAYDVAFAIASAGVFYWLPFGLILRLVAITFIALVWYGFRFMIVLTAMGIPHPKPIPFLGNLGEWIAKTYLVAMRNWQSQYGKIYGFYLGRNPTIVVADAVLFEQLMVKQQAILYNRPKILVLLFGFLQRLERAADTQIRHRRHCSSSGRTYLRSTMKDTRTSVVFCFRLSTHCHCVPCGLS